jgi:AcrR family transcriptional regulator
MPKATHHKLVQAAIETINDFGIDGATSKRISERAGVAELTLFRLFGNKAALIEAALHGESSVLQQSATEFTGQLEDDLLRLVTAYIELAQKQGRMLIITYAEALRRPELKGLLVTQASSFKHVIDLIKRYQKAGQLRKASPATAMVILLGPVLLTGLLKNANPELLDWPKPKEIVETFLASYRMPKPKEKRNQP